LRILFVFILLGTLLRKCHCRQTNRIERRDGKHNLGMMNAL
jgi:hypothetical protein